jgi:hypothetical protein
MEDNCVDVRNPDQANSDTDWLGDACDNCRYTDNPDQENFDRYTEYPTGEFVGDVCEPGDIAVLERVRKGWGSRLDVDCASDPRCEEVVADGAVARITYKTYLNSRQEGCEYPTKVPRAVLDIQMRWCSCLNSKGLAGGSARETYLSPTTCASLYFPDDEPWNAQNGRDPRSRVGWYEPLHSAHNVLEPTVEYPLVDATDSRSGSHSWRPAPFGDCTPGGEDHNGDGDPERTCYTGPLETREYTPSCSAVGDQRREERLSHRKELSWRWVDEYLPVPVPEGEEGSYGAQVESVSGEGEGASPRQRLHLWFQTMNEGWGVPMNNQFGPLPGDGYLEAAELIIPSLQWEMLLRRAMMEAMRQDLEMLERMKIGRPLDPFADDPDRLDMVVEVGLNVELGELQEHLHPYPLSSRARIQGPLVQPFDPLEDHIDPPLLNQYTSGSTQIEGSGLRSIGVLAPWPGQSYPSDLVLVHGGSYADGTYETGLWLGRTRDDELGQTVAVEWTGPIPPQGGPGGVPTGRAESVLLGDPTEGGVAVLFGGESAEGLLGDLWSLSSSLMEWTLRQPGTGPVPSPRADVGYDQSLDRSLAFLFGGQTEWGLSNELFAMDVGTLDFVKLWPAGQGGQGPEPRRGAAVAFDEVNERVFVFGGEGYSWPLNDLWVFDLETSTWERLTSEYCYSTCPPHVANAVAVFDEPTDRLRVVPGSSSYYYRQPTWSFHRREGWTHAGTDAQVFTRDCYGFGWEDPYHGMLCQNTYDWWATPGVMRCGDSYLTCFAPETQGELFNEVPMYGALKLVMTGNDAVVLLQDRIQGLSLNDPGSPSSAGFALLSGTGRDLIVYDGQGYAAAGASLEVVDLHDPLDPVMAGQATLTSAPHALARVGSDTVVASTVCGLSVIDVSTPEWPQELAFLWLSRKPEGWEGSSSPATCFGYETDPLPLTSSGSLVVLSTGMSVLVVDVSSPESPLLAGWVDTYEPAVAMRAAGSRVYSVAYEEASYGQVVNISSQAVPELFGYHNVGAWVQGAVVREDWAYRVRPWGVQVAAVEQ